jgi:YD repeat-containing protein
MERLEERHLLAANHVFAAFTGTIDASGESDTIPIFVGSPDFRLRGNAANVGVEVSPRAGSSFNPAAATILDQTGAAISPLKARDNLRGSQNSVAIFDLKPGMFSLQVRGEQGTTGDYEVNVFLVGDFDGSGMVTNADYAAIRNRHGARIGTTNYDAAADADLDGRISSADLGWAWRNIGDQTDINVVTLSGSFAAGVVQLPDGRFGTRESSVRVTGQSLPRATIHLDSDGDGLFNDGDTVANSQGTYSLDVSLREDSNPLRLETHDSFGQRREVALPILKDSIPPTLSVELAESTDSGPKGDLVTLFDTATLTGQTEPRALVRIVDSGASTIADTMGFFSFVGVPLATGNNSLAVTATDPVGNVANSPLTVRRNALPEGSVFLAETSAFLQTTSLDVALAQSEGSRIVEFNIDTLFDRTDATTASGDRLLVYLVNPANPAQTLLGHGAPGTAVFSVTEEGPEFTPGQVRFDGATVRIDVTSLITQQTGKLVFQLLSGDTDTGSRFIIHPLTYDVDEDGTASPVMPATAPLVTVGGDLDLAGFSEAANVDVQLRNVRYDAVAALYTAELSIKNNGPDIGRRAAVAFAALPSGATLLNPSGTTSAGEPYLNLTAALPPGGLEAGEESAAVLLQFSYAGTNPLALRPIVLSAGENRAPVLPPLGPFSVMPGGVLSVDLAGTDPDGDLLTYSLRSNGDLPTGTLNTSGKLQFTPSPNELGTYEFTVIASDGVLTAERNVVVNVVADPVTTTRISGQILATTGQPLPGVPISLSRLTVLTDDHGRFTIELPSELLPTEDFAIQIPAGDPHFDPTSAADKTISFRRARFDTATGTDITNPRRHPNLVSSFLDASMVYGSDDERAMALRTLDGSGKLKTSPGNLLPFNSSAYFPGGPLENDFNGIGDPTKMFVAGDVRSSENVALAAIHTILLREHNRLADAIKAQSPASTDEEIYQRARRMVGALIQHITYNEYLPLLLGAGALPAYTGYQPAVDPAAGAVFTTAAFRLGHSQMVPELLRIGPNGQPLPGGPLSLRDAFFTTAPILDDGIDPILRGLIGQQAQEIDSKVVDELRNFLFGPPGSGGMDLTAMNIQRGRDMGLPSYVEARRAFGLSPITSFAQITSNAAVQSALQTAYGTVEKIDVWVGGIAEDHAPGAMVGPLFQRIIANQFSRTRDGDRFWYENGQFTDSELQAIRSTTLADLIERNSDIAGLPNNVFTTAIPPAGPAPAGSSATGLANVFRSLSGVGNNLARPEAGSTGEHLHLDGGIHYGDSISSPAGGDRPLARTISNQVIAQADSNHTSSATALTIFWGQLISHDLALTPTGTSDVLKVHADHELIDGQKYPFVAEKLGLVLGHVVYEGVNNVIDRPIYLPAIDRQSETPINPAANTTVIVQAGPIQGASVHVAAGTLRTREGQLYNGTLSITEVPPDLTPAALPTNLMPDVVVTIQPAEMVFTTPAPLTLPNRAGYPANTVMDLWSINPVTGLFDDVGDGRVVDTDGDGDGDMIETTSGGIRNSSWHFFALLEALLKALTECRMCPCDQLTAQFSSEVILHSGVVRESHATVPYSSLGTSRSIVLQYDSLRADPRPIVGFETTISLTGTQSGPPPGEQRLTATINVMTNGVRIDGAASGDHYWRIPGEGTLFGGVQVDLRNQGTGLYDFDLQAGVIFLGARRSGSMGSTTGKIVSVNGRLSPFGNGWGIAGLQQLVESRDGSIIIVDGNGHSDLFERLGPGGGAALYKSPLGDFTRFERLADGTFRRTTPEQTVFAFDATGKLNTIRDRNGNQTQYLYNGSLLTQIVDPVGLSTFFAYENGHLRTITDPTGRVTTLLHDANGNLRTVTDPDGSSRSWSYDGDFHMVEEITKRGFRESIVFSSLGRAKNAHLPDGATRTVMPVLVQGLDEHGATRDPSTAPFAGMPPDAFYADEIGNVLRASLDSLGQLVSGRDSIGPLGGVERDAANLPKKITSPRDYDITTTFDIHGNPLSIADNLGLGGSDGGVPSTTTIFAGEAFGHGIFGADAGAMADMDADGDLDFVSIGFNAPSVYVLLANDAGRFETPQRYSIGGAPIDIEVADLNRDQKPDIVAANPNLDTISIAVANITGGFDTPTTIRVVDAPRSIALADLNGDTAIDIVTANENSRDISILLNNGNGTFATPISIPLLIPGETSARFSPSKVVVAEVTGDGIVDLVIGAPGRLAILRGKGPASFGAPESFSAPGDTLESLAVADINQDSILDIVATSFFTRQVLIFRSSLNGTFETAQTIPINAQPSAVALSDVNADGFIDIITANRNAGSSTVLLGRSNNAFGPPTDYITGGRPGDLFMVDVNHDTFVD